MDYKEYSALLSGDPIERSALQFLDELEEREYELLTWGFVDGGFTRTQLEELADDVAERQSEFVSHDKLLDLLENRRLIFSFQAGEQQLYRTRFAESIRLLFHLRQIFGPEQWASAPRLVADYRLEIRARRYPRRSVSSDRLTERLESQEELSTVERDTLRALVAPPGEDEFLLSDFQSQATAHLRANLGSSSSGGTIVCTGTGSGKTLAFYLPSLMRIVKLMSKDSFWTQVVAIYPRNVLLTDQFTEAYRQARHLDGVAVKYRGRKIRIGAFYGPTPLAAGIEDVQRHGWEARGADFKCPYVVCPRCGADMIWHREHILSRQGILVCSDGRCRQRTSEDEVVLTRTGMQSEPPDVLFTTTETLNRQLSSSWSRHVFGVDRSRDRSPYVMLLDEAHAYSGTHGAQVANLIRRWRALVRRPIHFVGLSATLRDPQGFFGQLVGLHPGAVTAIGEGEDMEEQGKEYHVILRGDPVSGTSLLSTSIQTSMLLGRILDPAGSRISQDIYGNRLFVFTDDLDVTNRLYHNLLDAEARDSRGNEQPGREPLASFRSNSHPDLARRFSNGQAWRICEEIGHSLSPPNHRLRVGRTSSQDVGVDATSNVVVATSSLEVGYNDPAVGAILQHKAPRDSASFIQRRGRAGRKRITRPWTVVVVSDYGRDRLAYQAYEQLFDPILDRPTLPIKNRYVLKMQMVYAFIDWMVSQLPPNPIGHVWSDFAGPARNGFQQQRQDISVQIIKDLLSNDRLQDKLALHLCEALSIDESEVQALLWEPPRALMTAVLPTLLRRLLTNWSTVTASASDTGTDYRVQTVPMPDFVSENLFSDLSLPEVQISTPVHQSTDVEIWSLPITQALNTIAPGRVTRRFGLRHVLASHWVAPPNLHAATQQMAVQDCCVQYEELGDFQIEQAGATAVTSVRCIRPRTIAMTQVPVNEVLPTSNAFLDWRSQIYYMSEGESHNVPPNMHLGHLVKSVTFFTNNTRNPLNVRRFAVGSDASIRLRNGQESCLSIAFIDDDTGAQAAMGFEQEVDGVLFSCSITDDYLDRVLNGNGLRSSRSPFFVYSVANDALLAQYANPFRLEWMAQVYLSVILEVAVRENLSVQDAIEKCHNDDLPTQADHVLDSIFQVIEDRTPQEGDSEDARQAVSGRGHQEIHQLLCDANVCHRLKELSPSLWDRPDNEFRDWLAIRLRATLGGALLQACQQIAPEYQLGDLYLDIDQGVHPPNCDMVRLHEGAVWVTENMMGGGGVVEEIAKRYSEDPRRFFLLVEMALGFSDLELVDSELTRIVGLTQSDQQVAEAFAHIRGARDNHDLRVSRDMLMCTLDRHNVQATHSVMVSLNARVLRAGSSAKSDALLNEITGFWSAEEDRLGVEIDARVFAYVVSSFDRFKTQLADVLRPFGDEAEGRLSSYSLLYGLLWPRGVAIRERVLASYNPYCKMVPADPRLIRDESMQLTSSVAVEEEAWQAKISDELAEHGTGRVSASAHHPGLLRSAILELVTQPIEADFLYLYPYVAQLQRTGDRLVATLHLREALQ